MAITVKLTNATVRVGGNFYDALAFVKSFEHLPFDRTTNTWTLPTTDLQTFQRRCSFPFDIFGAAQSHRSGEHVTAWGTRYSADQWAHKQAIDNLIIPDAVMTRVKAAEDAAEAALDATLASFGFNAAQIAKVRRMNERFGDDWDEAAKYGHIVFTSPERKAALIAAFDTYYRAMAAAQAIEDAARDAAIQAIDERYGVS